ncbi:MAG: DUF1501 domain-containing protein [Acidobacteria bacterium]|nr:DUF1501 domain-containing protein [Acidobacteriota bacterium]
MQSRRVFLRNGAFALVSVGFAPSFLARTALAAGASRARRLIAIFQRGAVDGLSLVVPFGEAAYYQARPGIAIAPPGGTGGSALDLDGFFGLHPRLGPLHALWRSGRLAIVHACGSPDSTRSHFDAQDYMETATPGVKSTGDGWLNRCLRVRREEPPAPLRAVALTPEMPRALQGPAPALAMRGIAQFGLRGGAKLGGSFEAEYAEAADRTLGRTGRDAFDALRQLASAGPARYRPAPGVEYPRSPFGQALAQIAQLAKADVGMEIAFAEIGGWDTHVNQGSGEGQLAARLDDFGRAVGALIADLGDRMDETVVLTMSEFGRAVSENGNGGTDHGHGNAMLVVGGGARGGRVYGRWPGLAREQRFEGRDLAVTTDFRDVFAEIVVSHLGVADPAPIFPGFEVRRERFPGLFAPDSQPA